MGAVAVINLAGRITLGDGSRSAAANWSKALDEGHKNILLNLADIGYIDSTGLGELVVSAYRLIKSHSGRIEIAQVNKKVTDLLQVTEL